MASARCRDAGALRQQSRSEQHARRTSRRWPQGRQICSPQDRLCTPDDLGIYVAPSEVVRSRPRLVLILEQGVAIAIDWRPRMWLHTWADTSRTCGRQPHPRSCCWSIAADTRRLRTVRARRRCTDRPKMGNVSGEHADRPCDMGSDLEFPARSEAFAPISIAYHARGL